ncbi:hypothetical protein H0H87_011797 [Tephrocybe sp. NHM501043]|nr:hypothetical protein H0H87_011797 [Tephrocybe sp. NHM501043]
MVSLNDINSIDVLCAFVGLFILRKVARRAQRAPLPPGPKGYPLIGNVLDMPSTQEWVTFTKWGEQYGESCRCGDVHRTDFAVGELASITVIGQPIIILNSFKIANELLDKKSPIYSDRPVLHMGGNLVGWKNTLVLLPYGDRFRRFRRMFHSAIGSRASVSQYSHIEELETRKFLRRVLAKPTDLATHVRHVSGAIILRISHGYEVKETNDPFVELADKATEQFSLSTAPGSFLVDVLPILRHVPVWFPGAGFQRKAKEWAATLVEMVDRPHNYVKREMVAGTAPASFTSSLLDSKIVDAEEEFDIKWSSASLYSGAPISEARTPLF